MAEMKTEHKSVLDYLKNNKFLIPTYQRTYTWTEDECEQLWDDLISFFDNKDDDDEKYFLGSIVVYKDKSNKSLNIIDGQQRTTTLSLFIRALWDKANNHKSDSIKRVFSDLSSCLWDTDDVSDEIDFNKVHLKSEVAIDSDNELLENILSNQYALPENLEKQIKKSKSLYEKNYLFFVRKIDGFAKERPNDWLQLCVTLLKHCIVLPIECDKQEDALRIFNTLNNRGIPLSAADIFKGLIYSNKKSDDDKKRFTDDWKELESKISNSNYLKKEDISFLFTQYEHILRGKEDEIDTVIPSTLDFFTKKDKKNPKNKKVNFAANDDLLTKNETFEFIKELGEFWCNPKEYLSYEASKYFDILTLYQNRNWQMILSMCYFIERPAKKDGTTSVVNIFDKVLPQLVSYLMIALTRGKGSSSGIMWGLMKANVNIKDKKEKIFEPSMALPDISLPSLEYFVDFSAKSVPRQIRYILAIYALIYDKEQEWEWNENKKNFGVITGEIEHIFPQKWQTANYNGWEQSDADKYLEQIGNKMLLEKKINILAGNGYFGRKKEQYKDSRFKEAVKLANYSRDDWTKSDIEDRNQSIYNTLQNFLQNNL
ncbi:MAG: DUF262 domain-containing protein [Neisseriaceae bacterium]|nr:DUF262 domain-containing protein [Neisseriaceae bacterium]